MSKSKEELNKIKEEVEAVNEKLHELTEEELAQVTGGLAPYDINLVVAPGTNLMKDIGLRVSASLIK